MSAPQRATWPPKAVVGGLLALHVFGVAVASVRGAISPIELFQLLLLASNVLIGVLILRRRVDLLLGGGALFLIAAHAMFGHRLAPDSLTSGAILMGSLLVLYVGVKVNVHLPARYWYAFVASYFALYGLFVVVLENAEPLFLLFLMGLAACARSLRLLAYFWVLTLSFTFCQPYAWEALFIGFFVLTALFTARGAGGARTAVVFLGVGLVLLFFVLFPVVVVVLGEDLHSLELVLRDARVRSAIWTTVKTATLSTALLVAFGVPLAYAVSRLRFRGRTLLLSFIDVPIVIPQTAAGIALVTVFGRQQFLGQLIERGLGIRFDGTLWGICLAQVFVALPFLAKSAIAAFDAVPLTLEHAARGLGAGGWGAFARVSLPLASRGIFLGAVLAWARAAGEFGAVLFLAPSPKTAPVAAYDRFNSVGVVESGPLVAVLLLFSLAMFFLLQFSARALPTVHGARGAAA